MRKAQVLTLAMAAMLAGSVLVSGCSLPTEQAKVVDTRPMISFKAQNGSLSGAQVYVDGIHVGAATDYPEGKEGLRVLSGTHVIELKRADGSRQTQRVYVGDGVYKTLMF